VLISVSIVEDDPAVRRILAEWIGSAPGFRCLGDYGDAERALAELPGQAPDIVLMDINLPKLDGIQCVGRLKPLMRTTQFVMLTVYEDTDHIFNALAAGATGYLLKETERDELIAALRQAQEGGAPMSGYIARKVVQAFQRPWADTPETNRLSPREREVLELLARGFFYKEISESLRITVGTVNTHVRRIYEKLQVRTRAQAVAVYGGAGGRQPRGLFDRR
jgi:DNA-binding NarL/FixJ family response regulator